MGNLWKPSQCFLPCKHLASSFVRHFLHFQQQIRVFKSTYIDQFLVIIFNFLSQESQSDLEK
jgi:hypothetical protein